MIGLDAYPTTTLLERALDLLAGSPRTAEELARSVLGLGGAPAVVAERLSAALLGGDPRVQRLPDGTWALVAAGRVGAPSLEECAFAVVDVETTGTRTGGADRVIELAVVVVHGARRELIYERLVNPGRALPRIVSALTRITDRDLAAAPTFDEIADEVLAALAGRIFVAHNVRFDWGFLSAELRRTRGLELQGPRLCTARLARRLVRGAESCGLDWLGQYFDLDNPARHRAGGDAWATAQLLERLVVMARGDGARTLDDLERLQARRPRHHRKKRKDAER